MGNHSGRQQQQQQKPQRQGASVSTKQLAYAATEGRRLNFPTLEVSGYLVGLDDYHYVIAVLDNQGHSISDIALIHKSASVVRIALTATLETEATVVREAVQKLSARFVEHCRTTVLGKPPKPAGSPARQPALALA